MSSSAYRGPLVIGDPHLESRQPGFRRDDYPQVILDKVGWCLDYASQNQLLPAILGDLFDKPRDNPNWVLCRLVELFDQEVIGLYGNHDCAEPALNEHDSLNLLVKAGRLRLVSRESPWRGRMNGRMVVVGGSSYRQPIPESFACDDGEEVAPLVIWLTHHDIIVPGYEEQGRFKPEEIRGVDLVVNGHIHRRLADVQAGRTLWLTPGNISRRTRNEASEQHVPAALRIDITSAGFRRQHVEVPHRPFEEVFHPAIVEARLESNESAFVAGLAELQTRQTASGAGLFEFLEKNLGQFEDAVANEIRQLAREVTSNVTTDPSDDRRA